MNKYKIYNALFLSAILLSAMSSANATSGDFQSDSTHTYVGLIAFYATSDPNDSNRVPLRRCSGTALTPHVFLTAGHCIETFIPQPVEPKSARIWFHKVVCPEGVCTAANPSPTTGFPMTCIGDSSLCATSSNLERFNRFATNPTTDVGIAILDNAGYTGNSFGKLANTGSVSNLFALFKGNPNKYILTASGYGLIDNKPVQDAGLRDRNQVAQKVISLDSGSTGATYIKVSANTGNDQGGICFGDSGGPHFYGDYRNSSPTDVILAVTSAGSPNCSGTSFPFRIDIQVVLDWIKQKANSVGETVTIVTLP